jgi:hypothetical protein
MGPPTVGGSRSITTILYHIDYNSLLPLGEPTTYLLFF